VSPTKPVKRRRERWGHCTRSLAIMSTMCQQSGEPIKASEEETGKAGAACTIGEVIFGFFAFSISYSLQFFGEKILRQK
jgi:hypothetical protein